MALEKHTIELTARDGVSQVFQKVAREADKAGKAGEDAGRRASKSMRDWSATATSTGLALGTLVGATSKLAQAHVSEARQIAALDRAYGDQADAVNELADRMQDLGIASDDAVRVSALGAQSLITNYGLTADQINQLIERSADLSAVTFDQQGNQLALADVMSRVAGAIRGEGEAAELLGLAMSDSAVQAAAAAAGLTGWTTTMTESEKAAFRFQLVLEQSSHVQGAAADQAEGLGGKFRAMRMDIVDSASALGGLLGPATESVAVLSDMALAAPMLGAGLGRATTAIKASSLASTVLGSAWMGPAGVAVGAVAVGAAIWQLVKDHDDLAGAADRTAERERALGASLGDLADQLHNLGLLAPAQESFDFFETITAGAEAAEAKIQEANADLREFESLTLATGQSAAVLDGNVIQLTDSTGAWVYELGEAISNALYLNGALDDGVITAAEMEAAQQRLASGFDASAETIDAYGKAFTEAMGLATDPRYNGSQIIDAINDINTAVANGTMTEEEGLAALVNITAGRDAYNVTLQESERVNINATTTSALLRGELDSQVVVLGAVTSAWETYTAAQKGAWFYANQRRGQEQDEYWQNERDEVEATADAYEDFEARRGDVAHVVLAPEAAAQLAVVRAAIAARIAQEDILRVHQEERHEAEMASLAAYAEGEKGVLTVMAERAAEEDRLANAVATKSAGIVDALQSQAAAERAAIEQATALYDSLAGGNFQLELMVALSATVADNIGIAAGKAADQLETSFRVIVGNTNATSGLVDNVLQWGEELINVEGTYGKIDDLYARGLISAERHGMAQRAYNRMVEDGAGIQEDILAIQAKQAPYIANDVRNLERQYTLLGEMEPSAARLALGWMDASLSAQAMEFQTSLVADAQDGLDATSQSFWSSYIDGLETANPLMLEMLESAGYVKKTLDEAGNWDGVSYEINLEGVEGAKSELGALTDTLDNLVKAYELVFEIDLNDDGVIGPGGALDQLKNADGKVYKAELEIKPPADPGIDFNEWEDYDFGGINIDIGADPSDFEATAGDVEARMLEVAGLTAIPYVGADNTDALLGIAAASKELGLLDGDVANVSVTLSDGASGTLSNIDAILDSLAGRTVTSYVETIYTSRGTTGPPTTGGYALGGVIGTAADGGMRSDWTMVGEHGPEAVHLPYGSLVTPWGGSQGRDEARGGGGFHFHGPVTIVANNPQDLYRQMSQYALAMNRT